MSRIYHSRRFARTDDEQTPLISCLQWAQSQAAIDFLIVAHQTSEHAREYEAMDETALRQWAREPIHRRLVHEVIIGPTKLFGDIDMNREANSDHAERTCDRFVDILAAEARKRFGVETSVLILDASRPAKVSRHFIIDMTKNSIPVRFATTEECGAFIKEVEVANDFAHVNRKEDGTTTSLCDYAIYRRNGTLRMYGSSQLSGQIEHALWPLGVPRHSRGVLSYTTLLQSLVAWPHVSTAQLLHVDVPRSQKRPRTLYTPINSPDVSNMVADVPPLATLTVRNVSVGDNGVLFVNCLSSACPLARRTHRNSTIFIVIDPNRRRWAYGCHSPHCKPNRFEWHVFSHSDAPPRYGEALASLFS